MGRTIWDSVVVITGASSGIGRATALGLAKQRGTMVLASRQEPALQEVARDCERLGGCPMVVPTDVTDEAQVKALARRAVEAYGRIDAWINDAAVSMFGRFEEAPTDAFRRVVETNFFGYVNGARAVLPFFRRQGQGVLINVASVLGKVGSPFATAYVASKFAVTGFSESLRMELRDTPKIQVCTILPGTIDTPLFQHAANFTGHVVKAPSPVYSPEQVAETIIRTILRPRREVTVGNAGRLIFLRRLVPPLAERVVAAQVEKRHFQKQTGSPSTGNLFAPMPELNAVRGGWRNNHGQVLKRTAWIAGAAVLLGMAAVLAQKPKRKTGFPGVH